MDYPIVITAEDITDFDKEVEVISSLINQFGCRVHLRKKLGGEEFLPDLCNALIERVDRRLLTLHGHADLVEVYNLGGYHDSLSKVIERSNIWGNRVIYSTSCHSIDEVNSALDIVSYLFLSPIFDSISKHGYSSNFDKDELSRWLLGYENLPNIIALGGVDAKNILEVKDMGFSGAALLGAVWGEGLNKAFSKYESIVKEIEQIKN